MKNIFKHLNKCLETFISSHFNFMLFSQFPLMTLKVVLPRDDQEREKERIQKSRKGGKYERQN